MKIFLRSFLIALNVSIWILSVHGQELHSSSDTTGRIYQIVDVMPQFPGGESQLLKYVADHIKYPRKARRKNIRGRVIANFFIDQSGNVRNIKIIKGIGEGCDEEVIRVLSKMPRWTPGKQDGALVNVYYNLPVNFQLR